MIKTVADGFKHATSIVVIIIITVFVAQIFVYRKKHPPI
jgi:hypothetical protein